MRLLAFNLPIQISNPHKRDEPLTNLTKDGYN